MNMTKESKLLKWLKRTAFAIGAGVLCISNAGIRSQAASQTTSVQEDYTAALAGGNTISDCLSNDRDQITYTLNFATDGRLQIDAKLYAAGFDISIYDSNGNYITDYECGYNYDLGFGTSYFYDDFRAGTYYMRVDNWDIEEEDFDYFTIIWNFVSANSNEKEPNDYYAQAQNLGKEAVIQGQLAINDGQDIYGISLSKKTAITLGIKSEIAECELTIYNNNGDEVWDEYLERKNTGYISETYSINLEPGFYYIYVKRSESDHYYTGPYTLTYSSKMTLSSHNVSLSTTSYSYNGKVKTPNVIAKDNFGRALTKGVDYIVTVPSGRKNIGTYTYKITFTGDYKGTVTKSFQIKPAKTKVTKLKKKSNGIRITWKKSSNASGYMIYRKMNNGSYKKIKTIKSRKIGSYLDKGARYRWNRYYYKVVAYKKVNGKIYKSKASTVKSLYRR